jgi:hypothetical protein
MLPGLILVMALPVSGVSADEVGLGPLNHETIFMMSGQGRTVSEFLNAPFPVECDSYLVVLVGSGDLRVVLMPSSTEPAGETFGIAGISTTGDFIFNIGVTPVSSMSESIAVGSEAQPYGFVLLIVNILRTVDESTPPHSYTLNLTW